jgi:hypothetical protein
MNNITYFTDELTGIEFVNIIHDDGSITGMTKETYDAQIAAQSTLPSESSIPTTSQAGE